MMRSAVVLGLVLPLLSAGGTVSATILDTRIAQADTSRPAVPDGFDSPDSAVALLVTPPGEPEVLVFRDFVHIEFDDTTSGVTIRDLFARYEATVAGGYPFTGTYIIHVPDPGPTYDDLEALLTQLQAEPGVFVVYRRVKISPSGTLGRFPDDGSASRREDWLGMPTDATRALRAIRAPLAWGCENGLYGSSSVGIGIIDYVFGTGDLDSTVLYPLNQNAMSFRELIGNGLSHGMAVSGIIGAVGDNGSGIAGLLWKSTLHQFRLAREVAGAPARLKTAGHTSRMWSCPTWPNRRRSGFSTPRSKPWQTPDSRYAWRSPCANS